MKKGFIILASMLALFGIIFASTTITIKGSDTLVRLGQRWAEEYMKINDGIIIQVSGGGTGTGVAALLNGGTDVCQASREMKEKEFKMAADRGVEPYRVSMALDGIAVFLHEKNPVDTLTFDQLKAIYTGQITNWSELGGNDKRIILYGRENNSGTYVFFKEHVLDKEDYSPYTQTLPGTAAVVNAVSKDENSLGYGGVAWAKGVKFAAVAKDDTSMAILPTMETISEGIYPISRELYWYFNGKPTGEIKELTLWALSEEGQELAKEIEYVPLSKKRAQQEMEKIK